MLAMLDAYSLHCACKIVGLDVPEEKKVIKIYFFNSEEVEASQDGEASWFQKLHDPSE